ncbi:hypothetical protein Sjap_013520 [Stephania japonica]|uniref:Uncharacterized protein n=1 Tax=Stephania japonica TaxID=461633 RepID=A0AAP0IZU8_9MAGN
MATCRIPIGLVTSHSRLANQKPTRVGQLFNARHVTSSTVPLSRPQDRPRDVCPHELPDLRTNSRDSFSPALDTCHSPIRRRVGATQRRINQSQDAMCRPVIDPKTSIAHPHGLSDDATSVRHSFTANQAATRQQCPEISQWPPTTIIMIDSKTHTIMVEACDFCGESFHPTYACPYHPRHGERHDLRLAFSKHKKYPFDDWSNSSYQQDTYSSMRNQPSRDIIRFLLETEQDMNLTEQELDQWIEQRDQEAEEEIKSILQKISAETMSAIPLESVEVNEVTSIEDYWSEPKEIIEVSLHEPDISSARNKTSEAEKEIDVILERPEESRKRSKEDQPLVLLWLPVKFTKGVVIKERSQIFYTADTFVSDDHDLIDSYVLEVPDELLHLKEGMYDELPKAIDAPFVVDISKGELITHDKSS